MIQRSQAIFKRILTDQLIRATGALFVATLGTGFANYGLQVILARYMPTTEFGFFNALLGVFVVLGVPMTTLLMVVSRKTSEIRVKQDLSYVGNLFRQVSKRVFIIGSSVFVAFLLFMGPLVNFLNSPSAIPILLLGLCVFATIMTPIPMAILQGLRDTFWFALLQGLNGPSRFLFCSLPVLIGWGVNGVMTGLLISHIVIWGLAFYAVRKHIGGQPDTTQKESPLAWAEAIPILVINLALVLITQMDLILVNRFFDPESVSQFASAAVLGRSVIYVPGALVLAMFPMVSEHKAQNVSSHRLLFKSLAVTILTSGVGAFLFYVWPEPIMTLLFGSKYAAAAGILKYYGLAMVPLAVLMVLSHYLIARKNTSFGYIMLIGAILEIGLIYWFHSSMLSVVLFIGTIGFILFAWGLIISILDRPSENLNSGELVSPIRS